MDQKPSTVTIQGTARNNSDAGPLRRTEEDTKAMQSMSLDDFKEALRRTNVGE
jgi:hypothetical protein